MIVGASGSGKSSLVGAGLLPRLASNAVEGSREWLPVRFSPGQLASGDPFEALSIAIMMEFPTLNRSNMPAREWTKRLHSSAQELDTLIEKVLEGHPRWAQLFLFIDQFEELFTLAKPQHIEPFIDLLLHIMTTDRIRLIITIRSDFYARRLEYVKLAELFKNTTYPLSAPDLGSLYEMITRPAARAGLGFEDGLPERILGDTGTEPGALALMAYTLDELYHASTNNLRLTHVAYETLNGVQGAIAARAESAFLALDTEAQATLPFVFRELTEVDERGIAIRRRADLSAAGRTAAARRLIDQLTEARLLVQSSGDTGQAVIEVAHEALLRNWTRLTKWIDATQEDLRLTRQVRLAADEWNRTKRSESDLLNGTRLEWARGWLKTGTVPPMIAEFIQTSAAAEDHEKHEEEERRNRESTLKQRATDQLRLLVAGLIVFLFITVSLMLLAVTQRGEALTQAQNAETQAQIAAFSAETATNAQGKAITSAITATNAQGKALIEADNAQNQAALAQANATTAAIAQSHAEDNAATAVWQSGISNSLALAAQAQVELQGPYAERAIPLAMEALQNYPFTAQAERMLYQAMRESRLRHILPAHGDNVTAVQWSPDGTRLLTASRDGTVVISTITSEQQLTLKGHDSGINDARWSPDGLRIVTASADNTAMIWNAQDGSRLFTLSGHQDAVNSADWSPDGKQIVTASDDGTAMIWDAEKGIRLFTLMKTKASTPDCPGEGASPSPKNDNDAPKPVIEAKWSPDGKEIASIAGTSISLWDPVCGQLKLSQDQKGGILTAFDWSTATSIWRGNAYTSVSIAFGDTNGSVRLWEPDYPNDNNVELGSNLEPVTDIEWSKSGDRTNRCAGKDLVKVC